MHKHLELVVVCIKSRNIRLETLADTDLSHELFHLGALLERRAVHDLPMVEHALGEGLAGGMRAELSVEAEGLGDREVSLDSEHGGSRALLLGEDLSTTLVQAAVDTTDGILWALDFDCNWDLGQSLSNDKKCGCTYQGRRVLGVLEWRAGRQRR
jgi:hypothetical protein